MKPIIALVLAVMTAGLAVAAAADTDFERLAKAAAARYTLPKHQGSDYATKFADWSTRAMFDAMNGCESRPPSNRYCDIITVVGADGHIRRVVFAPNNPYSACVQKRFRLGAVAPKPPGDSWPVHIRIIDGSMPKYKGEAFIMLFKRP